MPMKEFPSLCFKRRVWGSPWLCVGRPRSWKPCRARKALLKWNTGMSLRPAAALTTAVRMIRVPDDTRKEKNERVKAKHSIESMVGKIRELYGQWGIGAPGCASEFPRCSPYEMTLENELFRRFLFLTLLGISRIRIFFREPVVLQKGVIGVGRCEEQALFPIQEARLSGDTY